MKNEIIIYQSELLQSKIEVRVDEDTVWLNRQQIASLFNRDIKTIGKHINNALREELSDISVVAKFATTAKDGKTYMVEYYNLEVIISIGYRVKSKNGIQFRIWANKVLKDYLLKGYVLNNRMNRIEDSVEKLSDRMDFIDLQLQSNLPPKQGIFYNGQIFDAYTLIADIIRSANQYIILIDNYVDDTVLKQLAKRKNNVEAIIYTNTTNNIIKQDVQKHNRQYQKIKLKKLTSSHDRFLIIDKATVYHFGASLKDAGKKWFAFSKLDINANDIIEKL